MLASLKLIISNELLSAKLGKLQALFAYFIAEFQVQKWIEHTH